MHLVIVTDFFRPGNSRVLEEYGRGLKKRGHQITLLGGTDTPEETIREIRNEPFEFRPFHYEPGGGLMRNLKSGIAKMYRQRSQLQQGTGVDRLVFNQPFSGLLAHFLIGSRAPRTYIHHAPWHEEWNVHHPSSNKNRSSLAGSLRRWGNQLLRKKLEGVLLRKCDDYVVLSKFMRDRLSQNHPSLEDDRVHVIPGGVNLDQFHPGEPDSTVLENLGLRPQEPIIFTLRRLVPRTGVDRLIDSFGDLLKNHDLEPDPHLVIGGSGPLRDSLVAQARRIDPERIHFTGFVPDSKLPVLYRSADLFVLPTRELEGFGLVTLEALASGTPVLATDVGGSSEILGPLDPDLLLPRDNLSVWAKCMAKLLSGSGTFPSGDECRRYVEKNYSWDRALERFESMLVSQERSR